MAKQDGRECAKCTAYHKHATLMDAGNCYRLPPMPILAGGGMTALWPMVHPKMWCMAFEFDVDAQATEKAHEAQVLSMDNVRRDRGEK